MWSGRRVKQTQVNSSCTQREQTKLDVQETLRLSRVGHGGEQNERRDPTWDNSGFECEIRVYYSDASSSGKVQELGWVSTPGRWTASPKINYTTLTPGDKPVGAVTDLGPYGRIISVYENYEDNTIGGMCSQEGKWTPLFTIKLG
ncbi:hypothetical protein DFH08DRAFT_815862 [Mycena albidolilacea]|uniref:Uncharacterized protein n=1 Tax=Mycena albidolilacea TaxID=1033008 RepID=A0AAD6ZLI0_9AGAR|nr:hypothetical protein DFH08DRAFT_815862 [Mycena albidolilacea]